jgi:hypothetical protein
MRDIFRRIIIDFQERTLSATIKRDIEVPLLGTNKNLYQSGHRFFNKA